MKETSIPTPTIEVENFEPVDEEQPDTVQLIREAGDAYDAAVPYLVKASIAISNIPWEEKTKYGIRGSDHEYCLQYATALKAICESAIGRGNAGE